MRFLFVIMALYPLLCSCGYDTDGLTNYGLSLPELMDSLQVEQSSLNILIDKSEYRLSLLSDTMVIKAYPVVFGGNPTDDKLMEGDQCTPEGRFKMISKYPHKSWSKFIWINYPTPDSWKKHNKAKEDQQIPNDAKIGGEIGIHGVPKGMDWLIDVQRNWTLGCIALKNADINELYPYIHDDIVIEIRK